jgi:hypothetical protein
MTYLLPALVGAIAIAVYVWSNGVNPCPDGIRYTSGELQPKPFHRRWNHWNPRVLTALTWLSFVALAASMGNWQKAALFAALPGVWVCATLPTTVDGPSIAFAWGASIAWSTGHHGLAIACSILGGFIHERSPMFAAVYAWTPWLLVGLASPFLLGLRGAAKPKWGIGKVSEELCGHDLRGAVRAHRRFQDFLDWRQVVFPLRAVLPMAAYYGVTPAAWASFAVAFASRLVGTDTARFMLWAAPPMVAALPNDIPAWMVLVHVVSFVRMF